MLICMTVVSATPTARQLAIATKAKLGRTSSRSTFALDGEAAAAVQAAAAELGIDRRLYGWAEPGASLTKLADGFLRAYAAAYGPGSISQSIARSRPR